MLNRENFGRRHKSSLTSVFHGNDGGLQCDDRFAASNVALQQAIHRQAFLEVRGDFPEDSFLRRGGLKRKHAFQGFAHAVFAKLESNRIFLASNLATECKAELVEEKFFKNETLLSGRTELV